MKELNTNDYGNFLDHLKLSSDEIYEMIEGYELEFPKEKNEESEWRTKFPIFLYPFYKYIFLNGIIPRQNEFYEFYLKENKNHFEENKYSDEIMKGLKTRVYRAYASLVRDIHFAQYVKENFKDASILYNRELDTKEGIDLLIIYKSKNWGINLYTDTKNAHDARVKKEHRHIKFDNVNYVELPVNFFDCTKCGKFFLYGENEYKKVHEKIINQII